MVKDGEAIWAGGCRAFTIFYGAFDLGGCENVSVAVKWVLRTDVSEKSAGFRVGDMGDRSCEQSADMCGYCL